MKSWNPTLQVVLTCAFIGFGVLCGLAIATLLDHVDTGGVAPLFATSIGAGVGAAITLWVAEQRAQRERLAEKSRKRTVALAELMTVIDAVEDLLVASTPSTKEAHAVSQAIGNRWGWMMWVPELDSAKTYSALSATMSNLDHLTRNLTHHTMVAPVMQLKDVLVDLRHVYATLSPAERP